MLWLKNALTRHGLRGRTVREVLVDADSTYLRSPYRKQLEPTGTVWIGSWRPDLVCVVQAEGTERLAGFEVKSISGYERGLVQASRYREGVHEAYLCIPHVPQRGSPVPDWLREQALQNRIGLVYASPLALTVEVQPPRVLPDPRVLLATRRYLLGEASARSFSLNKPLHYAAALVAVAFSDEPWRAMETDWGLGESAIHHAMHGAETLGLLAAGQLTTKGKAYADVFRLMGFDLARHRHLTKQRLVTSAPHFAAVLRTLLLEHPAIDLVVKALAAGGGQPVTVERLAERAHALDEGLARAVFGAPPTPGERWYIRPRTRFQIKAALYDVGLVDTRLAPGASGPQQPNGYDPTTDTWQLGAACAAPNLP